MIYLTLFLTFLKIGAVSFGGGYAMIPLIREEVLSFGWLNEAEFTNFIAVAESTPGPIAVNMATFIGSKVGGIGGSLLATLGVVLPSFIIILLIMSLFKSVLKNKYFQAILRGLKPCVIGIVLATGILMIVKNCFSVADTVIINMNAVIITALLALCSYGYNKFSSKSIFGVRC